MAYIPGVQQTGKATIDFNCPERSGHFDRVGFTHLAFPHWRRARPKKKGKLPGAAD